MKHALISVAAFAALVAASPIHSNDNANTATVAAPLAVPTTSPHYVGHRTAAAFVKAAYASRERFEQEAELIAAGRLAPRDSDYDDNNHNSLIPGSEMLTANVAFLMSVIMDWGKIHARLLKIHNNIDRPKVPKPHGPWVDEYLKSWFEGYTNVIARTDNTQYWADELYGFVEGSRNATGQHFARRFETLAHEDVAAELEILVQDVDEDVKEKITETMSRAWWEEFGLPDKFDGPDPSSK